MGEKLQNLKPCEATCRAEAKRRRKPFTRMAKWEIRFQRFALTFRPSALDVCGFRQQHSLPRRSSAWRDDDGRLLPLAFAGALVCGPPREAESLLRGLSRCRVAKFYANCHVRPEVFYVVTRREPRRNYVISPSQRGRFRLNSIFLFCAIHLVLNLQMQ